MTHYEILGVTRDASHEQIRAAFKRLAQKHHPDRRKGDVGADRRMKEINAAYAILANAGRRAAYDLELAKQDAFDRERAQQEQSTRPNSARRNGGQSQHSTDSQHSKWKSPDGRARAADQPTGTSSERVKTRSAPPPIPNSRGSSFTTRERGLLLVACACFVAMLVVVSSGLFRNPSNAKVSADPVRPSLVTNPMKSAGAEVKSVGLVSNPSDPKVGADPERPRSVTNSMKSAGAEADSINDLLIRALRLHGQSDVDDEFGILGKLIGMGAISAAPIFRGDYTSYYFPQGVSYSGIRLFGQRVVLIEFDYMGHEGFVGCCVDDGYAVVLDVTDDIHELKHFAQAANCSLGNYNARISPEPITEWLTEEVKRSVDDLVLLDCRFNKTYDPGQINNR